MCSSDLERKQYLLAVNSMKQLASRTSSEVEDVLDILRDVAKAIDKKLNLE